MFTSLTRSLAPPTLRSFSVSSCISPLSRPPRRIFLLVTLRPFSHNTSQLQHSKMADLKVELTAPNGKKITLPTGLFINNEFVKSSSGDKITSINPS